MIYGNCVGGTGLERTYIIRDEDGNEIPAVMVENKTVFDATANDIRIGKLAATDEGITEGTKEIPSYYTVEGFRVVTNGSKFFIPTEYYDYTKLQAIFCLYNTSITNSVAAEKVAINDHVYPVQSTESEHEILKDIDNAWVDFDFTNDSGSIRILRYILYKEMY